MYQSQSRMRLNLITEGAIESQVKYAPMRNRISQSKPPIEFKCHLSARAEHDILGMATYKNHLQKPNKCVSDRSPKVPQNPIFRNRRSPAGPPIEFKSGCSGRKCCRMWTLRASYSVDGLPLHACRALPGGASPVASEILCRLRWMVASWSSSQYATSMVSCPPAENYWVRQTLPAR